eukprot:GEMP01080041.1.p1 GENE.GEMP01080041.1~~GEMP01080041.1.p1  ORF type:complete len:124 (+),score=10.96 GEMP01080041.1:208-579(+)
MWGDRRIIILLCGLIVPVTSYSKDVWANRAGPVDLPSFMNLTHRFSFDCSSKAPSSKPVDAKHIHPSHIKQVMTLGDSINAGFAIFWMPLEYRSMSWAGGEGHVVAPTVPWYLGHFSDNVRFS